MNKQHIPIVTQILAANDDQAAVNRRLLDDQGILALNIMASPGAGKTSVILQTIAELAPILRLGVIEGDTAPVTIDAAKVARAGVPAVQVNTGGGCHLDAPMLAAGLAALPLADLDLIIVENVGNLICPAAFDLGTHRNVVIASVPEGDDKPYKYPNIYRNIDALILNKVDLMPYVEFNEAYFRQGIELLNPGVHYFGMSCRTGMGVSVWTAWLLAQVGQRAAAF